MTNLLKKRKIVLSAFADMGATPKQIAVEKMKTLDPNYVEEWLAVIVSK